MRTADPAPGATPEFHHGRLARGRSAGFLAFLCLGLPAVASAQNPEVTVAVDAASEVRPIDPRIYGLAFATTAQLLDLNAPLNRWGGNSSGRYNWQQNADNRGSDYYFLTIPYASATPGERLDTFFTATRAGGAEPMLTIPMVPWVARLGPSRSKTFSYSTTKYAAAGCCAGTAPSPPEPANVGDGREIGTGDPLGGVNDPNDSSTPNSVALQTGWFQHLTATHGTAANGGLKYYMYDNEPSIWFAAYWDVAPVGRRMQEVLQAIKDYGTAVRAADPDAFLLGPQEWGWTGYFWSGYDQQAEAACGFCGVLEDRNDNGGADYVPFLLAGLKTHEDTFGVRLLDMFTLHYYPQGDGLGHFEFSNDVQPATQLLRNRSTRSLWDPAYVDVSWINDTVRLVPRMKDWRDAHYPSLQIGITEYNWGAQNHINGATTQADILGIFGREGLDLATMWTTPSTNSPAYNAFKMYRNYDGALSTFGDVSVSAAAPQPDEVAAFAATRTADGALTVMVVAKVLSGTTPLTLSLANHAAAASAEVWRLTSGNTIQQLADRPVTAGQMADVLPAQSITLYVFPPGLPPPAATLSIGDASGIEGAGPLSFTVIRDGDTQGVSTVSFATVDGTALAGTDYAAASGLLTFNPGETAQPLAVTVLDDGADEPSERFSVVLSAPTGASIERGRGTGTLVDDDGGLIPLWQLAHQSDETRDFATSTDHRYLLSQDPYASYEVRVEDAAGAAASAPGPLLDRLAADGATILQTPAASGPGAVRALRWENAGGTAQASQYVRVRPASCPACSTGDRYRIRAWETTGAIPRFNNAGSQVSVVLLQNPAAATVSGHVRFWSPAGTLLHQAPFSLAAQGQLALSTAGVPALLGTSGSITVAHDGPYGSLTGKTVALEPATGFSFDTPMVPR